MGKERQPGLDLLRCIGLFFVVSVHFFLRNGFYSVPQVGAAMLLPNTARWLFYCCNALFMLMTGYLKSTSTLSKRYYRGIVPILIGYVLCWSISAPVCQFLLHDTKSLLGWVSTLVTFGQYAWYVEMYIGLFLLAPIVNLALNALKTPKQLLWAAGTLLAVTAANSISTMNLLPDFWVALYPITLYVLGAVIRRLQPEIKPWLGILGAIGTALFLGVLSLATTDEGMLTGFAQGYGGFYVTGIAVSMFLALYRLPIKPATGKILAWAAGGTLEGYILSYLLDTWVYQRLSFWCTPVYYPLLYLLGTVPIFFCSLLIGKAVHTAAVWITGKIFKRSDA